MQYSYQEPSVLPTLTVDVKPVLVWTGVGQAVVEDTDVSQLVDVKSVVTSLVEFIARTDMQTLYLYDVTTLPGGTLPSSLDLSVFVQDVTVQGVDMVLIGDGNKSVLLFGPKLGSYEPLSGSTIITPVDVGAAVSQAVSAVLVRIHSSTGL